MDVYFPAGQLVQVIAALPEYFPAEQLAQVVAPKASLNFPGEHSLQVDEPERGAYLPLGQ